MLGGHVMDGCKVYTTAEIVLGSTNELAYSYELDPQTGYEELVVNRVLQDSSGM
jgi:predicted DNA-binding protein with PD1-like motif